MVLEGRNAADAASDQNEPGEPVIVAESTRELRVMPVGMAVLDEIESRDVLQKSSAVGEYLRQALCALQADHAMMGDVRGCGLFTGIEWVKENNEPDRIGAVAMANKLKDRGFLLSNAGALGNVLKIRPPLVFEQKHADRFLDTFKTVLNNG